MDAGEKAKVEQV